MELALKEVNAKFRSNEATGSVGSTRVANGAMREGGSTRILNALNSSVDGSFLGGGVGVGAVAGGGGVGGGIGGGGGVGGGGVGGGGGGRSMSPVELALNEVNAKFRAGEASRPTKEGNSTRAVNSAMKEGNSSRIILSALNSPVDGNGNVSVNLRPVNLRGNNRLVWG